MGFIGRKYLVMVLAAVALAAPATYGLWREHGLAARRAAQTCTPKDCHDLESKCNYYTHTYDAEGHPLPDPGCSVKGAWCLWCEDSMPDRRCYNDGDDTDGCDEYLYDCLGRGGTCEQRTIQCIPPHSPDYMIVLYCIGGEMENTPWCNKQAQYACEETF